MSFLFALPRLVEIHGSLCLALLLANAALAQTTPEIDYLFPPGAQRGTNVEVQLAGKFMPGPCGVVATGRGVSTGNERVTDGFTLNVAADAEPGPHELRIFAAQGASPPFPFLVGELPELIRTDQSEMAVPQLPITINAQLDSPRAIHRYSLELAAGQQIVCAVVAKALGSPLDANMRLLDAGQRTVASSSAQRSADALLVYRAPQAGKYTLQVFDFQLASGPQFIYRLTLTAGPWLDSVFPTAVTAKADSSVTLSGWNLPGENERVLRHPIPATAAGTLNVTLPSGANRLSLLVDELATVEEKEPNNTREQAGALTPSSMIHGRLQQPDDVDMFSFAAKKGESLSIQLEANSLSCPGDYVLTVMDEAGKTLVEVDDAGGAQDPSLRFAVPEDGRYFVQLKDRSRRGGDAYVYRLRVALPRPNVTARADTSSLALRSGQTTNLPVKVERIYGYAGELEITAVDLPAGVTAAAQVVPPGAAATVQLPLAVVENLSPIGGLVRIIVREKGTSPTREWTAGIAATAQATSLSSALWLAVCPEVPFTLKTTTTILDAPRMAAFPFPVSAERKAGFTGPIRLVGVEPDRRGTVVPLEGQITANSDAGAIPLTIQYGVIEGTTHRCRVMGVVDVTAADGKAYSLFSIAPGNMSMGCGPNLLTLSVDPLIVTAGAGESHTLRVQVIRRVPLAPAKVWLEFPADVKGVTCQEVTVPDEQSMVELTMQIASDAVLPPRSTVIIRTESERAGLPVWGQTSFRLETP